MSLQNLRSPFETEDVDFLHLRPLRSDLKQWRLELYDATKVELKSFPYFRVEDSIEYRVIEVVVV